MIILNPRRAPSPAPGTPLKSAAGPIHCRCTKTRIYPSRSGTAPWCSFTTSGSCGHVSSKRYLHVPPFQSRLSQEYFRENGGLLAHGPEFPIPAEQMTVEKCTDGCDAAGWTTAGLERGYVRVFVISQVLSPHQILSAMLYIPLHFTACLC